MKISDFTNKHVLILGYGKEGQAMERALKAHAAGARVTIVEKYPTEQPIDWNSIDVAIKSPGIPLDAELSAQSAKLTSMTQIFLDTVEDTGATVIGVTGSKGKSTTTTLIFEILKAAGKEVYLVGNIGNPMIDVVDQAKPEVFFVVELSSYQLMTVSRSPQIAVLTSFFPEHLDFHGSLENYREAKSHIVRFQKPEDIVFFNADSPDTKAIAALSPGIKVPYSSSDAPVQLEEIQLIGRHNLSNIAGAFKVSQHLGIDPHIAIEAIKKFSGLPHRLQRLGTFHGIDWVDDAISTTPESAIAALQALGNKVGTIIVGGQDRGLQFHELGEVIANSQIGHVILFPDTGVRIKDAILDAHRSGITFHDAVDMKIAVEIAKTVTKPGKICLLSTASPSYNMFKNFEDKGDQFQHSIRES